MYSSVTSTMLFWDMVSHRAWDSVIQLDCLVSGSQQPSCLCLPSTGLTEVLLYMGVCGCWLCVWVLGIDLRDHRGHLTFCSTESCRKKLIHKCDYHQQERGGLHFPSGRGSFQLPECNPPSTFICQRARRRAP